MDGELIVECDDAQEAATQFGRRCPKAETIVLLWLVADRVLNDVDAHFFSEVRPAVENIVLEIPRELES